MMWKVVGMPVENIQNPCPRFCFVNAAFGFLQLIFYDTFLLKKMLHFKNISKVNIRTNLLIFERLFKIDHEKCTMTNGRICIIMFFVSRK